MKLETFTHVIDFAKLKERLKNAYGTEALVTANRAAEDRFTVNVYLENIFLDKDISVVMRFNVDEDADNLLKFSSNRKSLTDDSSDVDLIKSEIEDHIVESIKLYNTEIESGNETMISKIEEFHSLIKEFNFEANPYRLVIVDDLLKLQVPKMHPHQKDRFFTIAKISEHSYENLIFIVKTQIQAINFYDELLCREDLFDVRFKMSKDRFFTLEVILKSRADQYDEVRDRRIIYLCFEREMAFDEIVAVENVPISTVRYTIDIMYQKLFCFSKVYRGNSSIKDIAAYKLLDEGDTYLKLFGNQTYYEVARDYIRNERRFDLQMSRAHATIVALTLGFAGKELDHRYILSVERVAAEKFDLRYLDISMSDSSNEASATFSPFPGINTNIENLQNFLSTVLGRKVTASEALEERKEVIYD